MMKWGHRALGALWGKSDAGGRVNLLLQHLLDTAAVAELIWDRYLAPVVRARIDACCPGRGRLLFVLLCGLHDIGKATPAFQDKDPGLADRVRAAGLDWRPITKQSQSRWHHTLAGAVILRRVLPRHGWSAEACEWVWPLIAGHHGYIRSGDRLDGIGDGGNAQGRGPDWEAVQDALVDAVTRALDADLADLAPQQTPRRAEQLAMVGGIIMADWIASMSDEGTPFPGIDQLEQVSMAAARGRAETAWRRLRLRGGWSLSGPAPTSDLIQTRFAKTARASQTAAIELAEQLPVPGLLLLEAPTGEGKTEAALAAAEVLARRFGADGIFVGMPTQATSDQMYARVRKWADRVESGLPVGLLHGKRRFNKEWAKLQRQITFGSIHEDESGLDQHGTRDLDSTGLPRLHAGDGPSSWFLGPHRGLLIPITVGTIDQLLHAATRTKFVMLRQAGLAGRVVILDEVHAYDVYMEQFLCEALRWLADAGVPVILLSATLPPALRTRLAEAYVQGATVTRDVDLTGLPQPDAYPVAQALWVADGAVRYSEPRGSGTWREPIPVTVQQHDEAPDDSPDAVVSLLSEALEDGGCALVIRNTVARAQKTYTAIRQKFEKEDVVLLHARLTTLERSDRTQRTLDSLGPPDDQNAASRPTRLIVVATQVAEQSFDVDVDLLVTDLAPIDLLLQRIGRLHRHERPELARPLRVRTPRAVIMGMKTQPSGAPVFPPGSRAVYAPHLLLRSAALVLEGVQRGEWMVPTEVPVLVRRGYSHEPLVPDGWREAAGLAAGAWNQSQKLREGRAAPFLLAGEDDLGWPTLDGLHEKAIADLDDEDKVAAVVRDGEPSVEVVLVRRDDRGYLTLGGSPLGPKGGAVSDPEVAEEVVGSTVRLPANAEITAAAQAELRPLSGWASDAWLRRARALVLDDAGSARLGGHLITYDRELGLMTERAT